MITDPTVVEPGSMATYKPGVLRYMAPELFNPSLFDVLNSDPTKKSDIYSFAMTTYEVCPFNTARSHRSHNLLTIRYLQRSYRMAAFGVVLSSTML